MSNHVSPMIHVPDVRAAVSWYERLGFRVLETFGDGAGGLSFGILSFGDRRIIRNQGGQVRRCVGRWICTYTPTISRSIMLAFKRRSRFWNLSTTPTTACASSSCATQWILDHIRLRP